MKKIVFTLLAVSLLGMRVSAMELDKPIVQNDKITITGVTDKADELTALLVVKPGTVIERISQDVADSNTLYAKQVKSDENGKFVVEFGLPNDCEENKIYPVVAFSGGEKVMTQFYYIKQTGLDTILNKFNYHEDTVENLLTYYSSTEPALDITIGEFYENNKVEVDRIFENNRTGLPQGKFTSLSQIESVYNTAAAIVKLNAINDKSELEEELAANKNIFNFETDENMLYETDNLTELFIKYRGNGFDNAAAVQSAYKQAYITSVINKTTDAEIIDEFIIKNAASIGITATDYSKYKSPTIGSVIAGKTGFKGYDDIKQAIASAITELNKKNDQGGGSTSNSSGGGGKTSNVFMPTIPSANTTDENKTETDTFKDLADVQWAKTAIEYLNKIGIVNGKGNGEFKPNETVLREEFAVMAVRLLDLPIGDTSSDFVDVKSSEWYAPYICAAYDAKLIFGKDEARFGIGDTITRQEMATILYRCVQARSITLPETRDIKNFADSYDISEFAKDAINQLYKAQIISGFDDDCFKPNEQSSRAQAAQMIYGIAKIMGM